MEETDADEENHSLARTGKREANLYKVGGDDSHLSLASHQKLRTIEREGTTDCWSGVVADVAPNE